MIILFLFFPERIRGSLLLLRNVSACGQHLFLVFYHSLSHSSILFSVLTPQTNRAIIICRKIKKSSGQGAIPYRWYSPRAARHDSVKLRSRQYSLDERRLRRAAKRCACPYLLWNESDFISEFFLFPLTHTICLSAPCLP